MFGWLSPYVGTLEGKAILITGCDSGFGRLMSLDYCEQGAHVFAACLTEDAAQTLADKASGKGRLTTIVLNITDEQQTQAAFDRVQTELKKENKKLYAVINNAGIINGWYVEMTEMAEFKRVMDVNFFGSVNITKTFMPLLQNPGGRIIGIISAAGVYVTKGTAAYASSKFAHNAFMDALRVELSDSGIKVIKVMPGGHKTEGVAKYDGIVGVEKRYENASADIKSRYADTVVEDYLAIGSKYVKHFGDPFNVVNTVREALLMKEPNPSYFVGNDAWFMGKVLSVIPLSWADWFQATL